MFQVDRKILISLVSCVALLILIGSAYVIGMKHGGKLVLADWNQEKIERKNAEDKLRLEYAGKTAIYKAEIVDLTDSLTKAKIDHERAIANINAANTERMRQYESRAGIYKAQSQSGTSECASLGSHATKLDRYLTEGIGLVEELTAVIKQRDSQLIGLGQQIRSDRKLLGDEDGK